MRTTCTLATTNKGWQRYVRSDSKPNRFINGQPKLSFKSLLVAMEAKLAGAVGKRCIIVLGAYFAVGTGVFDPQAGGGRQRQAFDSYCYAGKISVVGFQPSASKAGLRGRPRKWSAELNLRNLIRLYRKMLTQ
jgi:hypothetical protein